MAYICRVNFGFPQNKLSLNHYERKIMNEGSPVLERVPAVFGHEPPLIFGPTPAFAQVGSTTLHTCFTAPESWSRLGNILHGGFQGLLLDDIITRVVRDLLKVESPVPKELILRYHRPVYATKPVCIFGHLVEEREQEIITCGEIKDPEGNLLTEVEGILARTRLGGPQPQISESSWESEIAALPHWPAWSACCKGPLEILCDLHADWHLAPDQSALGGFLCLPDTLRQMPSAGVLAALFDQTLGLLGSRQGHGAMLTVRLQVTMYSSLPIGDELSLLSRGSRSPNGSFKAQAWLFHKHSLVAEANGHFSVFNRRQSG